jgi:hypothetical protein
MTFKIKNLTYYMMLEHIGVMSLRVSMGCVDVKDKVYELTFDI